MWDKTQLNMCPNEILKIVIFTAAIGITKYTQYT